MGILNDIFVADQSDVLKLTQHNLPLNLFIGVDVSGIDPIKIAELYSIVAGLTFETALDEQTLVLEISEDGPWISKIPDDLRDALAMQTESDLSIVSHKWAKMEEFQLDRWSEKDVETSLISIAELARKSKDQAKQMFLWSSL